VNTAQTKRTDATLPMLLRSFKLPAFVREYGTLAERAAAEGLSHPEYLQALAEVEAAERSARRIARLLEESKLPREKTLGSFDLDRLPAKVRATFATLRDGSFLDRAVNVIAFGNPGTGKTHLFSALGHELVRQNRTVLFAPAFQIVHDIGYVQQNREEMEVLFTLLAERYERKSVLITSNLVFSKWDQIFKDTMTTAAAVDRVVHHSVILELTIDSYRAQAAMERARGQR